MPRKTTAQQEVAHFAKQVANGRGFGDALKLVKFHRSLYDSYQKLAENKPDGDDPKKLNDHQIKLNTIRDLYINIQNFLNDCDHLHSKMEGGNATGEEQLASMNKAVNSLQAMDDGMAACKEKYPDLFAGSKEYSEIAKVLDNEEFTQGKEYLKTLGIKTNDIISAAKFEKNGGFSRMGPKNASKMAEDLKAMPRKLMTNVSHLSREFNVKPAELLEIAGKFIDYGVAMSQLIGNDELSGEQVNNSLGLLKGFPDFLNKKLSSGKSYYELFKSTAELTENIGQDRFKKHLSDVEKYLGLDLGIEEIKGIKPVKEIERLGQDDEALQITDELSWKNYMSDHYREALNGDEQALSKVLVGAIHHYNRESKPVEFSKKTARREAAELMKIPSFKQFAKSPDQVRDLLTRKNFIEDLSNFSAGLARPFAADPDAQLIALRNLKSMYSHMDSPVGRSSKWNAITNAMAGLDGMDLLTVKPGRDGKLPPEYEAKLQEIFNATVAYEKGKKSLRRNQDGRNRFDQSLDILAILGTVSPQAKLAAQAVFDRTNEVRRKHDPNHVDIDIDNYGIAFAKNHENDGVEKAGKNHNILVEADEFGPKLN
ncbi:MAG: hypothetical protein IKN24_00510 [Lachnospiraceae bacterium]|nr:hypothetical protein [Lachnospiraceae bacterium]